MWIGTVYMILELIPVLAMLFLLTLAAGNALWAIRLEQESRQSENEQADLEEPSEYTDDP